MREIWSREKIEWILFAPDYALVIPENLRYLIAYRDPERAYYLGHTSHFWNQLYNSGETAYVLSRGALRKIITKFNSSAACLKSGKYMNNEDYILGKHLSEMGVRPEDTRDEMGRQRFHLFTAAQLMFPDDPRKIQRFARKSVYPLILGSQCCSPSTISFKSTPDNSRYWFYIYLLYRVRLFTSGNLGNNLTNIRSSSLETAENFIYDTLGKHVNISAITSDAYFMLWKLLIKSPEEFNEKIRKETLLESNSFIRNITHNSALVNATPAVI
ncbi:hypothetical protein O3M35_012607 [Rhynocoris fuscipes]|uniref:Uncharacterized protein n=1 Tax=Rhynocoris fuscipes TaxID=488301 RepID=A0AAW1CUF4_9HEMI